MASQAGEFCWVNPDILDNPRYAHARCGMLWVGSNLGFYGFLANLGNYAVVLISETVGIDTFIES